ncbi:hypothetical protein B0H15DRAFT_815435 [Mycena belliarum]|uniref:Uncharacterized protein n=1 Tax=Mycena belliarum TaxID=1033014 RepID=A0AAD6UEW8_9AGAR|nr:hypothetical protein B0H15DRAFT_815435 [Mycena belliae]
MSHRSHDDGRLPGTLYRLPHLPAARDSLLLPAAYDALPSRLHELDRHLRDMADHTKDALLLQVKTPGQVLAAPPAPTRPAHISAILDDDRCLHPAPHPLTALDSPLHANDALPHEPKLHLHHTADTLVGVHPAAHPLCLPAAQVPRPPLRPASFPSGAGRHGARTLSTGSATNALCPGGARIAMASRAAKSAARAGKEKENIAAVVG